MDSRAEILDAAERLISEHGFGSMRMASLIKVSGHSSSSIYWHFESKEGVLAAVLERAVDRFFERAALLRFPDDDDVRSRLEWFLRESMALTLQAPQFLRLFILQGLLRNDYDRGEAGVVGRVRAQALRNLTRGLAEALRPWGEEQAAEVAAAIVGPALMLFDGAFLDTQVRLGRIEDADARLLAAALTGMAVAARR
nr:TetR/AcrR family transcriptional regulator [Propionibacterium sp.]